MPPIVSVITPVFNAANLVGQAIESVQSQTFPNWEMIIIDDCSSDDTCAVVRRYSSLDSRIRLISQKENGGAARARNVALRLAVGRYVAFLDSDDYWLPMKLELQLEFMVKTKSAISYTLYRRFTDKNNETSSLLPRIKTFNYHELLKNTGMACLTVMVDCSQTGAMQMPLVKHEDYALWLAILRKGFIAHGLQEDLARYRVSEKSLSSNKLKSATWVWNIYRNVEQLGYFYSMWCFCNYAWNALIKRKG